MESSTPFIVASTWRARKLTRVAQGAGQRSGFKVLIVTLKPRTLKPGTLNFYLAP